MSQLQSSNVSEDAVLEVRVESDSSRDEAGVESQARSSSEVEEVVVESQAESRSKVKAIIEGYVDFSFRKTIPRQIPARPHLQTKESGRISSSNSHPKYNP
jgi:hypothetical protein